MKYLVFLSFLLTLLGVFEKIEVFPGYFLYLHEPILVLIFLLEIKRILRIKENVIFLKDLLLFIGYFIIRILVDLGSNYDFKGFLYIFRLSFYFLTFLLFKSLFEKKGIENYFRKYLRIFIFFFLFVNSLQYILYKDLRIFKYIGWDPHYGRLVGPFIDPFLTAGLLGILFFLTFRLRYFIFSIFIFLFLLLTNSRGGILALFFSLFLSDYLRHFLLKFKGLIFIFPIIVFFSFFLNPGIAGNPFRLDTIFSRIEDDKKALKLVFKNPFFGIGYNNLIKFRENTKKVFKYSIGPYTPQGSFHSSYLTILVAGGMIGFILFLKICWNIYKIYPFSEFFIFLGIFSLFDNVLFHPLILLYLGISLSFLRSFYNC